MNAININPQQFQKRNCLKISDTRPVTVIDMPCGTGKTTKMIAGFKDDLRYLVVTPLLTEVMRVVRNAPVPFYQPEIASAEGDNFDTKKDAIYHLLCRGKNIVTTHQMYDNLADFERMGLLKDYEIVIDEVMAIADSTFRTSKASWEKLYIEAGLVTVDPEDGKITPTTKWDENVEDFGDTLNSRIYKAAKSGRLFHIVDGINIAVLPDVLMKAGRSLTVYTYKAEGSIMMAYLRKLGLDPIHERDRELEQQFLNEARGLITVKGINALNDLNFSYNGQTRTKGNVAKLRKRVPLALSSLVRNPLKYVPIENIMITCAIGNWYFDKKAPKVDKEGTETTPFKPGPYSKGSRMAPQGKNKVRATWVGNTTRGTNSYRHCTHAIYLYDQNLNPNIHAWFGGNNTISRDDYALTEFIQWLWRTQIRDGKPITVYIPSERMRDLFLDWLFEGDVPKSILANI